MVNKDNPTKNILTFAVAIEGKDGLQQTILYLI